MHPRTDIIVLVHNRLDVTKSCIEHLFANTSNFRLVFVDNGSDSQTSNFLKEGEEKNKWKVITSETNLGIIKGRNLGAKHVESDYFVNLDNDQFVGKNWLDQLHDLMSQGYDIVGADAWQLLRPGTKRTIVMNNQVTEDASYFPHYHCSKRTDSFTYVGCGGSLMKKSARDDIGDFDENYGMCYFEDPDFCFRALKKGYKIGWSFDSKITHVGHQTMDHQKDYNKQAEFWQSWNYFKKKWHPYFPEPLQME